MIINHNIAALNTYRQLTANNSIQQKSLAKLSSGLRINAAADDAAGLAISEKMRGQIRGLEQASRNAQDAISMIQTAEGALNETHSILQRMRELATQASSDTLADDDRGEIQKEMDQLAQEIDRIASTTQFNTQRLLRGKEGFDNFTDMASTIENLTGGVDKVNTNMASATITFKETAGNVQDASQIQINDGTTTYTFEFDADNDAVEAGAIRVAKGATFDDSMNNLVGVINNLTTFKDNFQASYDVNTNTLTIKAKDTGDFAGSAGNAVTFAVDNSNGNNKMIREEDVIVNGLGNDTVTFDLDQINMAITDGATIVIGGTTYEFDTDGSITAGNTQVDLTAIGSGATLDQALAQLATDLAGNASWDNTTGIFDTDTTGVGANITAFNGTVYGDAYIGTASGNFTGGVTTAGAQASKQISISSVPEAGTELKIGELTFKFYDSTKTSYAETLGDNEFGIDVNGKNTTQIRDDIVAAYNGGQASEKDQVIIAAGAGDTLSVTAVQFGETGNNIQVELTGTGNAFEDVNMQLQIGANENQAMTISISNMDAGSLGVGRDANGNAVSAGVDAAKGLDVSSYNSAKEAITTIDEAIKKVSAERSKLGAYQNRLEHTINNLGTSSENLTAAESRIRDVDMAKEMMEFTKMNILSQAAQAMLAQANQLPQGVLQLLR